VRVPNRIVIFRFCSFIRFFDLSSASVIVPWARDRDARCITILIPSPLTPNRIIIITITFRTRHSPVLSLFTTHGPHSSNSFMDAYLHARIYLFTTFRIVFASISTSTPIKRVVPHGYHPHLITTTIAMMRTRPNHHSPSANLYGPNLGASQATVTNKRGTFAFLFRLFRLARFAT
jgi:hypothetical protein